MIYSTVMYFLIMFLIPLVSLIILNYKLMAGLRRNRKRRESLHRSRSQQSGGGGGGDSRSDQSTNSRSEDEITRMLIVREQ